MDIDDQDPQVDRCGAERLDPLWVAERWAEPRARVIRLDARGGLPWADERLRWEPTAGTYDGAESAFLGLHAGAPRFATWSGEAQDGASLRDVALRLEPGERELATTAVALRHWHAAEPRCARCGAETDPVAGGFARRCEACGRDLFPRHDPAMIVAVTDDSDRLLLAHQASWAPGRLSLLAGFFEAGENLEQCVRREVLEEAGIPVDRIAYAGSQAWPFPRSLMFGCTAHALSTDVVVDGAEIEHAAFYDREQVRQQIERGNVTITSASISAALIGRWLGPAD